MEQQNVEQQVKEIVSKVLEIPEAEIGPDADFIDELGVDSLKAIEITGAIEKAFKIVVPEEEIRNIRTLNQAITLTKKLLSA
jgi:acyl carrier protein